MVPVILSGGVGSRLWPLSRGMYPKQLLSLMDSDATMLQETVLRIKDVTQTSDLIVVCNEEHRFMVGEQLNQILDKSVQPNIILETEGRNTAPAVALAALQSMIEGEDPVLLVLPADHVIKNVDAFHDAIGKANDLALQGKLVTFGVKPDKPEVGYGYIKTGDRIDSGYSVSEFKEKPNLETAEQYVSSGDYLWNSGMFAFKASVYLSELKKHAGDMHQHCELAYSNIVKDLDFIRVDDKHFLECKSNSIDYAVMELTDCAAIIPLDIGWSDVGSWSALWEVSEQDSSGNAVSGDVMSVDTKNSFVYSETKLISTLGVDNLVIVETDDAVLVANKDRVQNIKDIVNRLKAEKRTQINHHRKVYRPWGWYDSIDHGERFQVKRILVNPGAKLSVQMHHHRAEHWVVVSGVAEVLNGEKTMTLKENESTYIPIGVKHALTNPSKVLPLEIIEVQSGSYLGEDDIVRFEDQYGRI